MATVQHGALTQRYAPPTRLKREFDQQVIPRAVDAAAWCESNVLRAEAAVQRAPMASVLAVLLSALLLSLFVIPARRPRSR